MASGRESFEYSLKMSSYGLLATGLAALLVSEAMNAFSAAACLALLALSWRFETQWPKQHPRLVFLILGGTFLLDWLLISSVVDASLHLLLAICLVKLFGHKRDKDYGLLYAVSFLFLLIASVYTLSVLFLVVLIGYVFLGVLTFILFESRQSFRENPEARFELSGYLRVSLLMAVLVGLVSAPIFVTIPRTNWGLFRVSDLQNGNLSGFSDRVVLGDIGRIIQNRDLFMRFRLDRSAAELPPDLKWRGVALNHYDGHAWSNTGRDYQPLPVDPLRKGFVLDEGRRPREQLLRQQVTLEPGSDVVFGLGRLVQISALQQGLGGLILLDRNESLRFYRTPASPVHYSVYSDLFPRAQRFSQITSDPIPQPIQERFLQLPRLDPRIAQLANRITRDGSDPLARALLLESFLRRSFGYSLANTPASSDDPLAAFLFVDREGHCEFFATAMAVMLRTQGIPSRVVNGFRMGEFNDWSGYWVVRQSDAHSWVEAYFPGAGWLDFDPTPAGGGGAQPLLGRWVAQLLDAVDLFWTEVVTFDRLKQLSFFIRARQSIREGLRDIAWGMTRFDPATWLVGMLDFTRVKDALIWFGFLLLLPLTALFFFRRVLWRRWRDWRTGVPGHAPAPAYYLEFLDLLRRKGLTRAVSETPGEFAQRAAAALGSPLPHRLTHLYYRHRFGDQPPANTELRQARQAVKSWLRQLRGRKAPPTPSSD